MRMRITSISMQLQPASVDPHACAEPGDLIAKLWADLGNINITAEKNHSNVCTDYSAQR